MSQPLPIADHEELASLLDLNGFEDVLGAIAKYARDCIGNSQDATWNRIHLNYAQAIEAFVETYLPRINQSTSR